jgi:hypothetical protein
MAKSEYKLKIYTCMEHIIIPIDSQINEKELKLLNQSNTIFITTCDTIAKLQTIDDYPINKGKAIKKILIFLNYLDLQFEHENEKGFNINSRTLAKFFRIENYKRYLDILKEINVITDIPQKDKDGNEFWYKKGLISKKYRFFWQYQNNPLAIIILPKKNTVITKMVTDSESYNQKMVNTIKLTSIDYQRAITSEINHHLTMNTTINSLRVKLNKILSLNICERVIRKGIKVDRLYHTLSNLSRISRPFLSCKGNKFSCIDIKNCQPLILCYLLKKRGLNIDSDYINDCENAVIYERFISNTDTREQVKVQLYKHLYFDFKPHEQINKRFKGLYPLTWLSLKQLNKDKSISIAALLQNCEASIFNNLIVESQYYYTLFDSVYFSDENETENLKNKLKLAFSEFGLLPKF